MAQKVKPKTRLHKSKILSSSPGDKKQIPPLQYFTSDPVIGEKTTGEVKEESNSSSNKRYFVAIHVGAGYHSPSNEKAFRHVMKRACLAAASILQKDDGTSLDAVAASE